MDSLNKICLVIPAYNAGEDLFNVLSELSNYNFNKIIVIDDGSEYKYSKSIHQIIDMPKISFLRHKKNLGKGAALKTGFKYFLDNYADTSIGVVTVDADGQHIAKDVLAVSNKLFSFPNNLILGVRSFDNNTPLKSKIGNIVTKIILKLVNKIDLEDTQTGLRGIPKFLICKYITLKPNRYDFEFECLLLTKNANWKFKEVRIETVYKNGNKNSHFNPLIDSIKIYFIFFRFVILALLSFLLDISLFMGLLKTIDSIFLCTFIARVISGCFNFYYGKYKVFKSHRCDRFLIEMVNYCMLALLLIFLSSGFVKYFTMYYGFNLMATKIVVDSLLFFLSFYIQRFLVFNEGC